MSKNEKINNKDTNKDTKKVIAGMAGLLLVTGVLFTLRHGVEDEAEPRPTPVTVTQIEDFKDEPGFDLFDENGDGVPDLGGIDRDQDGIPEKGGELLQPEVVMSAPVPPPNIQK